LPSRLERIAFGLRFRGRRVRVVVTRNAATYDLQAGDDLELRHHGVALIVTPGEPATQPIPPAPVRPAPTQPATRAPARRTPR
jgi:alpha,alpha-trehalose phosphorylase